MTSNDLRTKYLKFFESKGHLVHPSDSLVPDDPSLLYTSAGMVQFKAYFVGDRVPPCKRIVTSQKCMRTDDMDEVGDAVHHTFFEMLGNFSFGDYFKREAITWAWEFLTKELEINPQHLWTSVYLDDDEAAGIWINELGFPKERLVRLGEDKNYWPANAPSKGPNGVCGPCNEIFLDVRPEDGPPTDPAWSIAHDGNRFVEIWNLVFTQYLRGDGGTLTPLPFNNIDTGMGLERTISILNGTPTNYETDLFRPIIAKIEALSGEEYGSSEDASRNMRVIADHIRSAVFALADGVMPSNAGRGYVLRRLIRNAVLKGRKLGMRKPFMAEIVGTIDEILGSVYPDITDRRAYIEKVLSSEEEKFRRTLESGLDRLENQLKTLAQSPDKTMDGDTAFALYDTYGFPLELTRDIAAENGIKVDEAGFTKAMEEQRTRAKEAGDFGSVMVGGGASALLELEKTIDPTNFVGYDRLEGEAEVVAIISGEELLLTAEAGHEVGVVLDNTPFYAETGGQVGDAGFMSSDKVALDVLNTVKAGHFSVHQVKLTSGKLAVGDFVCCKVDAQRRMSIERNHSATHLLHAALHKVVGEHALQAGSVVEPGRLRFDFSHFQALTDSEIWAIEDEVNSMILADVSASTDILSLDEARKMGATALFGEKYGDKVRVVRMGDFSMELCGGTHLCRTSQVGLFKITSESSVGAGLRRLEAVTGFGAISFVHDIQQQLRDTAEALGSTLPETVAVAGRVVASMHEFQKQIDQLKSKDAAAKADEMADAAEVIGDIKYVNASLPTVDVPTLQKLADSIIDKLGSGVVVLAGVADGRIMFVAKISMDLTKKGFHAGNTLREVAKVAGGGGGGRPDFAQAGGKDASKAAAALEKATEIIKGQAQA